METCEVLGVSFAENYPDNLFTLQDWWETENPKPTICLMTREQKNKKSVVVYCLSLDGIVGHLPDTVADRIAPIIDSGVEYRVRDFQLTSHPMDDDLDRPGMSISFEKSYLVN
jgi:hypothetical protein